MQVSRLLHLVLSGIDGQRAVSEIAARVSAEFGRTVSTGNVEYLLDRKLAPLGLLARADGAPGPANPGWDQGVLTLRFRCTLIPEARRAVLRPPVRAAVHPGRGGGRRSAA